MAGNSIGNSTGATPALATACSAFGAIASTAFGACFNPCMYFADSVILSMEGATTLAAGATLPANPREKQKQLARAIVAQYYSSEIAIQAQQDAEKIVLAGNTNDLGDISEFDLKQINFPVPLHYLVKASGLCKSNSEAQSQIKNGAVKLDGEKLSDRTFATVEELSGKVLQVGKKKFLRLT